MHRVTRPLLVLLAIAFLIEAWLWRRLEPVVGWFVACIPLRALKARLAGFVRTLPPAAALVVFVVPAAMLLPLKVAAVWLLAHKQWIAAGVVLVLAKLVGLGVTAFMFGLVRPKLLRLRWFRWLYDHVLAALGWAHRLVAPVRRRVRRIMRIIRNNQVRHAMRLFMRIRRRVQRMRKEAAQTLRTNAPRAARTVRSP